MKRFWVVLAASIAVTLAGVAVADTLSSATQSDFFASGKHRFYVWCSTGGDYTAFARGASAEDAQLRLYTNIKAQGHTTCWPVWQGRISG